MTTQIDHGYVNSLVMQTQGADGYVNHAVSRDAPDGRSDHLGRNIHPAAGGRKYR